jgi:hypothetical protein
MIFKIFSPKNSVKKLAFLTENKAKLCKLLIIALLFEKNAIFFAENCQKSQKIVIITLTPDRRNEHETEVRNRQQEIAGLKSAVARQTRAYNDLKLSKSAAGAAAEGTTSSVVAEKLSRIRQLVHT